MEASKIRIRYSVNGYHIRKMKTLTKILLVFGVFIIYGCASPKQTVSDTAETQIELDELNRLIFKGHINSEAVERLFTLYDESADKPDLLFISSQGGSIEAAMDMADWIIKNEMHVEVGSICASSCANYIFPVGQTKRLSQDSILFWHGSAWQKSFDKVTDPNSEEYIPIIAELREREVEFFSRIGVDHVIAVYGQGKRTGVRAWLRYLFKGVQLQGFDYSLEDLSRMGVDDIVVLDEKWNWREHYKTIASEVRRVSLDDDYEFRLNRFEINKSMQN